MTNDDNEDEDEDEDEGYYMTYSICTQRQRLDRRCLPSNVECHGI